jgi:hypothetical protein
MDLIKALVEHLGEGKKIHFLSKQLQINESKYII